MELILIEFSPGLDGGGIVHGRATGRFMVRTVVLWWRERARRRVRRDIFLWACEELANGKRNLLNGKRNLLNLTQNLLNLTSILKLAK